MGSGFLDKRDRLQFTKIVHVVEMAGHDLLQLIFRVSGAIGHSSVVFDKVSNSYCAYNTRNFFANALILFLMQMCYFYYVYATIEHRFNTYGHVFAIILIVDSILCFCLCYLMIYNGFTRSKSILKLLNQLKVIMENVRCEINGPQYRRL